MSTSSTPPYSSDPNGNIPYNPNKNPHVDTSKVTRERIAQEKSARDRSNGGKPPEVEKMYFTHYFSNRPEIPTVPTRKSTITATKIEESNNVTESNNATEIGKSKLSVKIGGREETRKQFIEKHSKKKKQDQTTKNYVRRGKPGAVKEALDLVSILKSSEEENRNIALVSKPETVASKVFGTHEDEIIQEGLKVKNIKKEIKEVKKNDSKYIALDYEIAESEQDKVPGAKVTLLSQKAKEGNLESKLENIRRVSKLEKDIKELESVIQDLSKAVDVLWIPAELRRAKDELASKIAERNSKIAELDAIKGIRKLNFSDLARFGGQILEALDYLHAAGYVHGDLKLDNILFFVGEDGTLFVKLADFGKTEKFIESSGIYRGNNRYKSAEGDLSFKGETYGAAIMLIRLLEHIFLDDPDVKKEMLINLFDKENANLLDERKGKAPEGMSRYGVEKFLTHNRLCPQAEVKSLVGRLKQAGGMLSQVASHILKLEKKYDDKIYKDAEGEIYKYIDALIAKLETKFQDASPPKNFETLRDLLKKMTQRDPAKRLTVGEALVIYSKFLADNNFPAYNAKIHHDRFEEETPHISYASNISGSSSVSSDKSTPTSGSEDEGDITDFPDERYSSSEDEK